MHSILDGDCYAYGVVSYLLSWRPLINMMIISLMQTISEIL